MKSTEIRIRKIKEELLGQATKCFSPRYGGSRMNRADVLDAVKKTICEDRQDTHGNPEETFTVIAEQWNSYLCGLQASSGWSTRPILSSQDVAVMMVLFKCARQAMNPKHLDNMIDACGYAAIAAELGQ